MNIADHPVPKQFRTALDRVYGAQVERVVLFGSQARSDARPDSDYGVAVFLREPESFWTESGRIAKIGSDILFETGAVINALPFAAGAWEHHWPLMREMRRDGVDL